MKTFLIYNTQATGDSLLSTHLARLIKEQIPNSHITFAIRSNMTLTTAEQDPKAINEVLEIIALQYGIDNIGIVHNNQLLLRTPVTHFDKEIICSEWFSDYGLVMSQLLGMRDELVLNTETKFNVGEPKIVSDKIIVAIAGPLDWKRKWNNELQIKKFFAYMENQKYIEVIQLGRDISNDTYLQSLKKLNNCSLLISPIGSLVHLAAGLEVDTISLTSVFPSRYDTPEFYHSGYHKSIKCLPKLHCGSYKCVTEKNYNPGDYGFGNPPTEFGFWPKDCPYTVNGKSCVVNITADQIISEFEIWLKQKNLEIK